MSAMPAADAYAQVLAGQHHAVQPANCGDALGCLPAMLEHGASPQVCPEGGCCEHRWNLLWFHYPLGCSNGSARKAGEHLDRVATGGEAEPSPPQLGCQGYAFTQPPPTLLRYGVGLARQTFVPRLYLRQRAGCLRTSPQNPMSPARWCSCLVRAGGNYRIAEAYRVDRAAPLSGGFSRGGQHVASCIKVYVARVSMNGESKNSRLNVCIRLMPLRGAPHNNRQHCAS